MERPKIGRRKWTAFSGAKGVLVRELGLADEIDLNRNGYRLYPNCLADAC
jgi:hypothetical protein